MYTFNEHIFDKLLEGHDLSQFLCLSVSLPLCLSLSLSASVHFNNSVCACSENRLSAMSHRINAVFQAASLQVMLF